MGTTEQVRDEDPRGPAAEQLRQVRLAQRHPHRSRQAVEGVELDLVTMPGWPLKLEKTPIRTASPSITNELIRLRRAASVRSQSWPFCVPRRTRFSVALNYQAISVVFYREASPA